MSYVALFATGDLSVATDRRVLPPGEVQSLQHAQALVQALQAQRELADARALAAADKARREGYASGFAAGEAAARKQLAQAQVDLASRAQREREALRAQTEATVAMLALEVVRKLAGEIDAAELVSALARTAVQQLIEDEPVTLVVHPAVARRVRERCQRAAAGDARWPTVSVEEDATLKPFDCRLVTRAGTTVAGLDAQLRRLETVWGDAGGRV
ncbi:FliH/SctL family protein [Ideonella sp. BN130291]|uniref:FliH/SctL family protein n=1 Tax=Ideonella sp. BN130291 TaxID=3112940 RepID=UPI002E260F12|nr:FliH/SctL family protein [Ideonella sp. BN130291]